MKKIHGILSFLALIVTAVTYAVAAENNDALTLTLEKTEALALGKSPGCASLTDRLIGLA